MQKEVYSITHNWRFDVKKEFSVIENLLSFVHNQTMNCIRHFF